MLNDGRWHALKEVQQKMELNENQIRQVIVFLTKYNFMIADETREKIKLKESVRKFLTQKATS